MRRLYCNNHSFSKFSPEFFLLSILSFRVNFLFWRNNPKVDFKLSPIRLSVVEVVLSCWQGQFVASPQSVLMLQNDCLASVIPTPSITKIDPELN